MRGPDPIEIWRGEAQHPVVAQHAAAFAQQHQRVDVVEVLDEVLGEDEGHVLEGQPVRDVEHAVDARQRLAVDIDPAG